MRGSGANGIVGEKHVGSFFPEMLRRSRKKYHNLDGLRKADGPDSHTGCADGSASAH